MTRTTKNIPRGETQVTDTFDFVVTGAGSIILTWTGATSDWDYSVGNWSPANLPFVDGVDVLFDDSAAATTVSVEADVSPNNMTVNNASKAYIFNTGDNTLAAGQKHLLL